MDKLSLQNILKDHDLRVTACRLDALALIINLNHAFTAPFLEDNLDIYDRVTLYRTISSFLEKGIIHSIPDDSGVARYAVCHETCSPGRHSHDHMHFKCNQCGNIECIPTQLTGNIQLPGYHIDNVEVIVSGKCKSCAQ